MSERTSTYKGKAIEITYDRKLCIHAAECGRGSKELFNVKNSPWCDPDAVAVELAADVVSRCPTGALKAVRDNGEAVEEVPGENIITVSPDGPLYIRGNLEIEGVGDQGVKTRAALCRCGASANKPLCDGQHSKAGFKDAGPVGDTGTALSERGGVLKVTLAPKGPLLLSGNFTIRSASGRDAYQNTKAALCRCGASKNRPFCDGSHTDIGFSG